MRKEVAIVTGAGRGIGAEVAKLLARAGYYVVVNYRENHQAAESVVTAIHAADGQALALQADISDEFEVAELFQQAAELGNIRALVNNAGILSTQSELVNLSVARVRRILDVNVIGTFLCCREGVRYMREHNLGGAIVNVSSLAAKTGSPFEYVDYAASKGAVDSLTIGLAKEVGKCGIRVNAVRPGCIDTDIHADGGEPGRPQRLGQTLPIGRAGEAKEVAKAICWLISDDASYTTGAIMDVAGGL